MLNYKPEIDGLRAVAVIPVILYHAQFIFLDNFFFQGGFIGVDIFFVISGYLITIIILKELNSKNNFSFLNFFERRIRRILPVLLLVIIITLPFASHHFTPLNLIRFSESLLSTLLFISNYYFWETNQIYGEVSGLLKPMLHTWSLSVE